MLDTSASFPFPGLSDSMPVLVENAGGYYYADGAYISPKS